MRWLLAGASGFLGSALRVRLAEQGDEVARLVRREPAAASEFAWDPPLQEIDRTAFDGVDVVVNLAGVNVLNRIWTTRRRKAILSSRVDSTGLLAATLADLARSGTAPPLIQTSGVARYGTVGSVGPYTEDDPAAGDFLAQVTVRWEQATDAARAAGVRVVIFRTSPVMDRSGSAFLPMRLAWSCGLGAVLGDGSQRMPMISLTDYLRAIKWAAETEVSGPCNLTLPEPTTNAEFTHALAQELRRPCFVKVPAVALRTPLGEQAEQLLGDMYVFPRRLLEAGFTFTAPDVTSTIRSALRSAASRTLDAA